MSQFPGQGGFQMNYPGVYSPGQMAFNNNTEMSQLVSMFAGPLLGQMTGPGQFVPHMMPTQQMMDQYALRNHQNNTRTATLNIAGDDTQNFATSLLGARSAMTKEAPTALNREQAANMAGIANNPIVKGVMGQMFGHDNVEAAMHGSRGDVSALGNSINRMGYFMKDPTGGGGRPDSNSLEDYTRGVYAHMYAPQGNLETLDRQSRAGDSGARESLKKAARMEQATIVEDDDVAEKLQKMDNSKDRVGALYEKYVNGGKATDTATQAKELVKFDRAIKEAGVLEDGETTVGGLRRRANNMPANEMHGFMAGQVGQIADNMLQRGMLPQSLGSMTAADRVRAINATPMDDETVNRLSREAAHRDLSRNDNISDEAKKYQKMTATEKEEHLDKGGARPYKDELEATRKEIEKTATGASGAKSETEIAELKGFDALAGNADAKRGADKIKEMTGAVAAIRDIFGDNGNPNAPMPALLAALEGLTGGAIGSMKPQKIADTLRQMQTTAKEAGIGFDQMASMSAQMDAQGASLGLTPADTMRLKGSAMAAAKVMQDTGAFSNPIYGQTDKGTALNRAGELMAAGAASPNAQAMGALESMYQANPERFKGKELEVALEAYRNNEGDGTYTYNGQKKNIREMIGRGGVQAAAGLGAASGVKAEEFTTQFHDPATRKFTNKEFGYLMQPYEMARDINNEDTRGRARDKMRAGGVFAGMSRDEENQLSQNVGRTMTDLIMETSDLERPEQIDAIKKTMETKLAEDFEKQGMAKPLAEAQAQKVAATMSSRDDINAYIAGAGAVYSRRTGGEMLSAYAQRSAHGRNAKTAQQTETDTRRAERKREAGLGTESTPTARIHDYLFELGESGENFTENGFMEALAPILSDKDVRNRYAKEMVPGFEVLDKLSQGARYTNKEIDKLASDGKMTELRKLAGVSDKTQIVTEKQAEQLRNTQIATSTGDDKELARLYKQFVPNSKAADPTKERKSMLQELRSNNDFMVHMDNLALGEDKMTADQVSNKAKERNVGKAHKDRERDSEDINKVRSGFFNGADPEILRSATHAATRLLKLDLSDDQTKALQEATTDRTDKGKKKLETLIDKGLGLDAAAKKDAQALYGGLQSGSWLEANKTLGGDVVKDPEMVPKLTQKYIAEGMSKDAAAARATDEVKRAEAEAKKAGGPSSAEVKQRSEKMEVDAQTVIIKGAKIEIEGSKAGGGSGGKADTGPGGEMPTDVAGVDKAIADIESKKGNWFRNFLTGGGKFNEKTDQPRLDELNRRREELLGRDPGPQPDRPLDAPTPAPLDPVIAEAAKEKEAARKDAISRDEDEIFLAETSYGSKKADIEKREKAGEDVSTEEELLDVDRKKLAAMRAAKKEGIQADFDDDFSHYTKTVNGVTVIDEAKLSEVGVPIDEFHKELDSIETREEKGESAISDAAQKYLSAEEKIEAAKAAEAAKEKPATADAKPAPATEPPVDAVAQANDQELLKQAGGVSSANIFTASASELAGMIPGVSDVTDLIAGAIGMGDKTGAPNAGRDLLGYSSLEDSVPDAATLLSTSLAGPAGYMPVGSESAVSGAVQAVQQNVQQVSRAPQLQIAGGGGSGNMNISGTLSLSGLQEAIMSAQGQQVIQTEGGAPVVADPMLSRSAGPAPAPQYTTPINHLNPAPVTG